MEYTTIRVSCETQQILVSMGGMGDSYDDVIRMLFAAVKEGKGK